MESVTHYNLYLSKYEPVITGIYYHNRYQIERHRSLPIIPHIASIKDIPIKREELASEEYNKDLLSDRIEIEEIPMGITLGLKYRKPIDKLVIMHEQTGDISSIPEFKILINYLDMKYDDIKENVGSDKVLFVKWGTSNYKNLYNKLPMMIGTGLFDLNRKRFLSVLRRDSVLRSLHWTSGGLLAGGPIVSMETIMHSLMERDSLFSYKPMPISEIYVSKSATGEIKSHGRILNYEYDVIEEGAKKNAKNFY
jgi:hypothetical protein